MSAENIPLTHIRIGYSTVEPSSVQTETRKGGGQVTGHTSMQEVKAWVCLCQFHGVSRLDFKFMISVRYLILSSNSQTLRYLVLFYS